MKKFFLMSLIAAFVMVLNVNAQDNTYNMVVKMLNGTEITIGPNEIENIFFNDGEIVVKGTKLEDLLKRLAEVKVWTIGPDGYWYLDGQKTEFKATGGDGQSVDYKPMIAKVEDELLAAKEKHENDFELLKLGIEEAMKLAQKQQNPNTNEFLRELMERVDRNTKEIDTLKAEIEELRKQLNNGSRTR